MPEIPEYDDRGGFYNLPGESTDASSWIVTCMKIAIKAGTFPIVVLFSFLRAQGGLRDKVINSYRQTQEEINREK